MSPFGNDQLSAEAVGLMRAKNEIPRGYYQRSDGIVEPERLKNPEPEITICGDVDEVMFRNTSENLQKIASSNSVINGLRVNFSSFGGKVTPGFGVHDLIKVFGKDHKAPVVITGYGPIMSMGALIIQAGDIRRMPENSRMLLHPLTSGMYDQVERLEHKLEEVKRLQMIYTKIVSDRVNKTGRNMQQNDVVSLMEANNGVGTFLSSQEALELGLIDEVI